MTASDTLTVLRSASRAHAGKRFKRGKDGQIRNRSYGKEAFFSVQNITVGNIVELARALDELARHPYDFIIRGEALDNTNRAHTRRLLYAKGDQPATFADKPRHWFLVDVDHIAAPALTDPREDPEGVVEYVIGLLPELVDASCFWQFSASQSVLPDDQTISLHLWFWSLELHSAEEMTRWARAQNKAAGVRLINETVYRAVQPHYITAPTFEGMNDPLPRRCGLRQGLDDAVSLLIPSADAKNPEFPGRGGYEPGAGVEAYLAEIGGPKGFRAPIMSAIASYISSYGSRADVQPLYTAIREAIVRAEPHGDLGRYRRRHASRRHHRLDLPPARRPATEAFYPAGFGISRRSAAPRPGQSAVGPRHAAGHSNRRRPPAASGRRSRKDPDCQ